MADWNCFYQSSSAIIGVWSLGRGGNRPKDQYHQSLKAFRLPEK
jgi:hypothetical protein